MLDDKKVIKVILASEGGQIFLQYFRTYLSDVIAKEDMHLNGVTDEFLMNHITGSFIEMIRWWAEKDFEGSPKQLSQFFIMVMPGDN